VLSVGIQITTRQDTGTVVVFSRHPDHHLSRYRYRGCQLAGAGADETKLTREALKWPYGEFEIPEEVYDTFGAAGKKGQALEEEWNKVSCAPWCSRAVPVLQYVCAG